VIKVDDITIISVQDLKVYFKTRKRGMIIDGSDDIKAVDGVSFEVNKGISFGIVGESGSGKTVLLRSLVRIIRPTSGEIYAFGKNILTLKPDELKDVRRRIQLVFQNPSTSLHPRMTIEEICSEPLLIHKIGDKKSRQEKIAHTLKMVGLNPDTLKRYPHQFSGGQRQRIGLARALVLQPDMLLCDEPVSALDVSIRAQVLNLFQDLKTELNLTYLIIAHDLSAVRYLCSHVAIIYLGKFVEMGTVQDLYFSPKHPYTEVLIASVPTIEKSLSGVMVSSLPGDLPNPLHPPTGCPFHPRCPIRQDVCVTDVPSLKSSDNDHWVACHFR
jgi:oligopeptide transport system ATP-binding protein